VVWAGTEVVMLEGGGERGGRWEWAVGGVMWAVGGVVWAVGGVMWAVGGGVEVDAVHFLSLAKEEAIYSEFYSREPNRWHW